MGTFGKIRRARVRREICVACGCCVPVCPKKAISVFKGMYAQVQEAACVGCGKCAGECPASAITVDALSGEGCV